jgi:serine/threonine protein kinase
VALKKGYDYTGNKLIDNQLFFRLLGGLLEYDPERRMQPSEISESEFLKHYCVDKEN